MDGTYVQLGLAVVSIATASLGIIYFVVKYFTVTLTKKDDLNQRLSDKLSELTERDIESRLKLTQSIEANTELTKATMDNLTRLILKILKK